MHVGASLSDSVIMFCHMRRRAYVLCVGMCVYVCVCVCMCVCMQVLCSRMVKVHLHNVYWYTCIRVCKPSIKVYSVGADRCVGKKKLKSQQVVTA